MVALFQLIENKRVISVSIDTQINIKSNWQGAGRTGISSVQLSDLDIAV